MPRPPNYQLRCARFCVDGNGMYRNGQEWIHIYGVTQWVCHPCAELLGRDAGLPTREQQRRAVRARERREQMRLDEAAPGPP
jgi:hypothetical protein